MELRDAIKAVLARLPVRCDDNDNLDDARRGEAADAILSLPQLQAELEAAYDRGYYEGANKTGKSHSPNLGHSISTGTQKGPTT